MSYYLDGVRNTDFLSNVNLPFPMPDALQEFSVQTSNYSAEYGQNSGGVVNIFTKSGTNQFHGTVFDYARNGYFNACNYFANVVDPLKRQQFGGAIGGPITQDKLFFFFGYQGTRIRTATSASSTVPTVAQINAIPVANRDAAAYNLLSWLPVASGSNGLVTYTIGQQQNPDEYTGRGDYTISANDHLLVRYFQDVFSQPANLAPHNLLTYADYVSFNTQNVALKETHISSPNLLNDFTFGYMHESDLRGPPSNTPTVATFGVNITQAAVPALEGVSVTGYFSFGSFPQGLFPRSGYSGGDTIRCLWGRHSLAFGGNYEPDYLYEFTATNSNGVFSFSGNSTGNAVNDFLTGRRLLGSSSLANSALSSTSTYSTTQSTTLRR